VSGRFEGAAASWLNSQSGGSCPELEWDATQEIGENHFTSSDGPAGEILSARREHGQEAMLAGKLPARGLPPVLLRDRRARYKQRSCASLRGVLAKDAGHPAATSARRSPH